jgi:hypothetical protein
MSPLNYILIGLTLGITLVGLFNIVQTVLYGSKPHLSERERNKLIDELQNDGFTVYRVFSGRSDAMSERQIEAAKHLHIDGYLVFSDERGMEAFLHKVRPTSNEVAKERREHFKLIKNDESSN